MTATTILGETGCVQREITGLHIDGGNLRVFTLLPKMHLHCSFLLMVYFVFAATDTQNESMEVGEEDDPEFNYIAEAETEEIEAEEVRFDGPFRVTRTH